MDVEVEIQPFNVAMYEPSDRDKKYIMVMQRLKRTRLAMEGINKIEKDSEKVFFFFSRFIFLVFLCIISIIYVSISSRSIIVVEKGRINNRTVHLDVVNLN